MKKLLASLFSVVLLTAFCSACQPSVEKPPQTDVPQSESDSSSDSLSDESSNSDQNDKEESDWSEWA